VKRIPSFCPCCPKRVLDPILDKYAGLMRDASLAELTLRIMSSDGRSLQPKCCFDCRELRGVGEIALIHEVMKFIRVRLVKNLTSLMESPFVRKRVQPEGSKMERKVKNT